MNSCLASRHLSVTISRGLIGVLTALLATLSPLPASAGFMLQPSSASTSISTFGGTSAADVVNQSGMWSNYTSGVTDFASFMAGNPSHSNAGGWKSGFFDLTGNFDFDLGGAHRISGLAMWSLNDGTAIQDFRLLASDDATFTNVTVLGTFTNAPPGAQGFNFNPAQVFTFTETDAAFVRMEVLSNQGSQFNTSLLEVAFDASPAAVPEPSSLALTGMGLVGGGVIAWCRRRAAKGVV